LLRTVVEGVPQIIRLLSMPRMLVDKVGTCVDVPAVVGVALVMRWLVGRVRGVVLPWLVLLLRLLWRRAVLEVVGRWSDVYARVCSCRQCWASKCRGL
jgi:hypothetical protein